MPAARPRAFLAAFAAFAAVLGACSSGAGGPGAGPGATAGGGAGAAAPGTGSPGGGAPAGGTSVPASAPSAGPSGAPGANPGADTTGGPGTSGGPGADPGQGADPGPGATGGPAGVATSDAPGSSTTLTVAPQDEDDAGTREQDRFEAAVTGAPIEPAGWGKLRVGMAWAALVELLGPVEPFVPASAACFTAEPRYGAGWPEGASLVLSAADGDPTHGALVAVVVMGQEPRTREGIGIGSTESEVRQRYATISVRPHPYITGGHDLTVYEGANAMRFESDGVVFAVHVGRPQFVDLVDGCA